MNGQWLGKYNGSNTGTLVLDLDDRGDHFEGYVYAYNDDLKLPSTYAEIRTPDKGNSYKQKITIFPVDPHNGNPTTSEEISKIMPGVLHGTSADISFDFDGKNLTIEWTTDMGVTGKAVIPKSRATEPTDYTPDSQVRTWKQFKEFATSLEPRQNIFRGQRECKRLRTSFHRTGRADLHTFLHVDRLTLHRHLSHRTKHIFNLESPDQNGAFLNLVQHHGYPTPILDWTYSPFVAAFFAYRKASQCDGMVRIFMFD